MVGGTVHTIRSHLLRWNKYGIYDCADLVKQEAGRWLCSIKH